jgi:hypothetical protein
VVFAELNGLGCHCFITNAVCLDNVNLDFDPVIEDSQMLRLLFWNLNRMPLLEEVASLAIRNDIDLLVLAEDDIAAPSRLEFLNRHESRYFMTRSACKRITLITRFSDRFTSIRSETDYYTFREVHLPLRESFLLVAIHWKAMWRSEASQSAAFYEIGRLIREQEISCAHQRTIVVGDFNVEPYANGMMAGNGLHAVMSRRVAARGQRELSPHGQFPFFYNPMWSVYGDESNGPPGTYYRSSSEEVCQFWYMRDQVLIRPQLLPYLPARSVTVLTEAGTKSLINVNGHPSASDHLPIVFQFDSPQEALL